MTSTPVNGKATFRRRCPSLEDPEIKFYKVSSTKGIGVIKKTDRMNYRCRPYYDDAMDAGTVPAVKFPNGKPAMAMSYSETKIYLIGGVTTCIETHFGK
jgi:hypothetical protein